MLPEFIKNRVKDLWNKFWAGGISNPLNAIEQITYLLFIKQIDDNDKQNIAKADLLGHRYQSIFTGEFVAPGSKEAIQKDILSWSNFSKMPSEEMYNLVQTKVFPFIKQLGDENSFFTKHMQNAALLIPSSRLLTEAVKSIDAIFYELKKENRFIDAQGDFYEYLLSELNHAGKNGQFRTPTHIIELIIELLKPKLGDKIADPACGTSGFLLGAYKYLVTQYTSEDYCQPDDNGFLRGSLADNLVDETMKEQLEKETLFGFDIDPTMIRIGLMNLMMHGISQPQIDYKDTLSKHYNQDNNYDVVLANPPFTGKIDKGDLNDTFSIKTTKSELLFLERIYKMLRMGGTAGVVVPQGVLFGSGKAFIETRRLLIDKCELKAVISMPSGVFKPYAGVSTAILIFTKGGDTKDIWFFDMISDGKSLDDKRTDLKKQNGKRDFGDLHFIIQEYEKREKNTNRTLQHFTVPKSEIVENDYDLSFSNYREEVYVETKYEDPQKILDKISLIEDEISKGIDDLRVVLSWNSK